MRVNVLYFIIALTTQALCMIEYTLKGALQTAGWICRDPETREEFYYEGPCVCGPSCARLGNCCQDSEYLVQEDHFWEKDLPPCMRLTGTDILDHMSCPPDWQDNGTRTRCEQPDITYPDPLLDVPVTSRRTNITYFNGHCAICNGDFNPSVDALWPFKFTCGTNDLQKIFYVPRYLEVAESCDNSPSERSINDRDKEEALYDEYHYEIFRNFSNNSPVISSLSECVSYNSSASEWTMNLTCGFLYHYNETKENYLTSKQDETEKEKGNYGHHDNSNKYKESEREGGNYYYHGDSYKYNESSANYDNFSHQYINLSNSATVQSYENYDTRKGNNHTFGSGHYNESKKFFRDDNSGDDFSFRSHNKTFSNNSLCNRKHMLVPIGNAKCSMQILQPGPNGEALDFCPDEYVQTCAGDWRDRGVQEKCQAYTFTWCDGSYKYRNPYCAYCNHEDQFHTPACTYQIISSGFTIILRWDDLKSRCADTHVYDEVRNECRSKTNFNKGLSRLMEETGLRETDKPVSPVLGYVTIVGLSLSVTCLVLHLLVFMLTPKQRNLAAMNLASLCVSLLFLYCSFLTTDSLKPPCAALAAILHYTVLVTFFWMTAISFDVWKTIRLSVKEIRRSQGPQWKKFCVYSTVCWIVPLIVIASALIVEFCVHDSYFRPDYGVTNCWIGNRDALLLFVVAPLCIAMTLNIVFFSWSFCLIYFTKKKIANASNARTDSSLFLRLAIIMGLTWITGLIAALLKIEAVWYVFVVLNTLQGVFIFLAFSCRRKMWEELRAEISIFWTTPV